MITMIEANKLKVGDVFSTDGYVVESAAVLYDGRVSLSLHIKDSGGIKKSAVLDGGQLCPIYRPDFRVQLGVKGARRVRTFFYETAKEAEAVAARWRATNSQGSYFAKVTDQREEA